MSYFKFQKAVSVLFIVIAIIAAALNFSNFTITHSLFSLILTFVMFWCVYRNIQSYMKFAEYQKFYIEYKAVIDEADKILNDMLIKAIAKKDLEK